MQALAVVSAIGTVVSAVGSLSQGAAARQAGEFNARQAEREGELAAQQAAFEQDRINERMKATLGSQRAAVGASGGTFTGSPLLLMAEAAENAELEVLASQFGANVAAERASSEAALRRLEGRSAERAGLFKATSTLLVGGLNAFEKFQNAQDPGATTMRIPPRPQALGG